MATAAKKRAPVAAKKSAAKNKAAKKPAAAGPLKATGAPRDYKPLAPERVKDILARLRKQYPHAVCALHHKNAWQLLIATILSAQCTDVRVNMVTPALFKRFPAPAALAKADQAEVEELIRTTGFFRNKAKSVIGASKAIVERFGGEVPKTMDELLTLPGVARKTANVVLGSWFGIADGVVVDTHVFRLSRRLDLTTADTPEKVERDLMAVIPRERWVDFAHELIHHGRQICVARQPKCADCPLENICHAADKTWSTVWMHKPVRGAKTI
jgi:endonuclease III